MKVQACVLRRLIVQIDDDKVSLIDFQYWPWRLAVHQQHLPLESIRSIVFPSNGPIERLLANTILSMRLADRWRDSQKARRDGKEEAQRAHLVSSHYSKKMERW